MKLTSILLFLAYGLCSGISLILLKQGMSTFELSIKGILYNTKLLVGFAGYVVGFLLWMYILSRYRLNIAFPLATAIFFMVSLVGSAVILHESFTLYQIIGVVLCFAGIVLINIK